MELEGGMPVAAKVDGDGRVESGELPGGDIVTTMHVGPYEKLVEAHDALHVWMRENGKQLASAHWEIYWTDPGQEPNPANYKTELRWPIKR